jgi:hypothetical protein
MQTDENASSQDTSQEGSQAKIDTKGLKQEHIPTVKSGEGHNVSFDIDGLPDDIFVGDLISLVVFGQCSSGCDLRGDGITITSVESGEQVASSTFVGQEDDLAYTDGMLLTMPPEPGDYQYRIHYDPAPLPPPDDGGPAFPNPHPKRDLLLVITVKKHHVTLSTWGLTSPVWINDHVEVCVGASCSDGCSLEGCKIEVYDAQDKLIGSGDLKPPEDPRPKLWWTKIESVAPSEAKLHRWEARFVPAENMDIPHEAGNHKFSFVARVKPDRQFTLHAIDEKTGKPQRSARVEIKPSDGGKAQFATTGVEGKATIGCSKGKYDLKVTSPSRKNFTESIDLTDSDLEVEVHLQPTSSTDEKIPMKILSGKTPAEETAPAAEAAPAETAKPSKAAESAEKDKPAKASEPVEADKPADASSEAKDAQESKENSD